MIIHSDPRFFFVLKDFTSVLFRHLLATNFFKKSKVEHSTFRNFEQHVAESSTFTIVISMFKCVSVLPGAKGAWAVPAAEHSPGLDFLVLLHQGKRT